MLFGDIEIQKLLYKCIYSTSHFCYETIQILHNDVMCSTEIAVTCYGENGNKQ